TLLLELLLLRGHRGSSLLALLLDLTLVLAVVLLGGLATLLRLGTGVLLHPLLLLMRVLDCGSGLLLDGHDWSLRLICTLATLPEHRACARVTLCSGDMYKLLFAGDSSGS